MWRSEGGSCGGATTSTEEKEISFHREMDDYSVPIGSWFPDSYSGCTQVKWEVGMNFMPHSPIISQWRAADTLQSLLQHQCELWVIAPSSLCCCSGRAMRLYKVHSHTFSLMTTASAEICSVRQYWSLSCNRRGRRKLKEEHHVENSSSSWPLPQCYLGVKMQLLPHRDVPGKLLRLLNSSVHTLMVLKQWKKKNILKSTSSSSPGHVTQCKQQGLQSPEVYIPFPWMHFLWPQ